MDSNKFKGHAAMTGAEVLWGVSAPLGKGVLMAGVSPLLLTDCRTTPPFCSVLYLFS